MPWLVCRDRCGGPLYLPLPIKSRFLKENVIFLEILGVNRAGNVNCSTNKKILVFVLCLTGLKLYNLFRGQNSWFDLGVSLLFGICLVQFEGS